MARKTRRMLVVIVLLMAAIAGQATYGAQPAGAWYDWCSQSC